jgi:hypothetical protein
MYRTRPRCLCKVAQCRVSEGQAAAESNISRSGRVQQHRLAACGLRLGSWRQAWDSRAVIFRLKARRRAVIVPEQVAGYRALGGARFNVVARTLLGLLPGTGGVSQWEQGGGRRGKPRNNGSGRLRGHGYLVIHAGRWPLAMDANYSGATGFVVHHGRNDALHTRAVPAPGAKRVA